MLNPRKVDAASFLSAVICGLIMFTNTAALAIEADQAKIKAQEFLDNVNMELTPAGFTSWGSDSTGPRTCYHFVGPKEERVTVDVDLDSGVIRQFNWSLRNTQSQKVLITEQQAKSYAEDFLKKRAKVSYVSDLTLVKSELGDSGAGGIAYHFSWSKIVKGIRYPFAMNVTVSADAGTITRYLLVEHAVTLTSLSPQLPEDKAISKAASQIKFLPDWRILGAQLYVGAAPKFPNQALFWEVRVQGIQRTEYNPLRGQVGIESIATVKVDATTGEAFEPFVQRIKPEKLIQLRPAIPQPKSYLVRDFRPYWSKSGYILFLTYRQGHSRESKSNHDTTLRQDAKPQIALASREELRLVLSPPRWVHTAVPTEDLNRIAFWMNNEIFILDLKTGFIGQCNDGQRIERGQPSWDSTGNYLLMAGMHSPSDMLGEGDADVFIAKIDRRLSASSMAEHWCVAVFPGADNAPVFSPDGKSVAFMHFEEPKNSKESDETEWAIYLAKSAETPEGKKPEKPRKIISKLPLIERMSFFPEGKRMLISYSGNEGTNSEDIFGLKRWPDILDLESKTIKPLNLPILHDPDLPQGKPLVVREPILNPGGTKIAFSALRWSGDPKDDGAICIYTCNLDGSDLKRITPPTAEPLIPHQYPQPGITALNAWEKLEPKRNMGVPWTESMREDARGGKPNEDTRWDPKPADKAKPDKAAEDKAKVDKDKAPATATKAP